METLAADFNSFALNDLCCDTNFATSSYTDNLNMTSNFNVPVFKADDHVQGLDHFRISRG